MISHRFMKNVFMPSLSLYCNSCERKAHLNSLQKSRLWTSWVRRHYLVNHFYKPIYLYSHHFIWLPFKLVKRTKMKKYGILLFFIYIIMFIDTQCMYVCVYVCMYWISVWYQLFSAQWTSFCISYKINKLLTYYISICLSKGVFI